MVLHPGRKFKLTGSEWKWVVFIKKSRSKYQRCLRDSDPPPVPEFPLKPSSFTCPCCGLDMGFGCYEVCPWCYQRDAGAFSPEMKKYKNELKIYNDRMSLVNEYLNPFRDKNRQIEEKRQQIGREENLLYEERRKEEEKNRQRKLQKQEIIDAIYNLIAVSIVLLIVLWLVRRI